MGEITRERHLKLHLPIAWLLLAGLRAAVAGDVTIRLFDPDGIPLEYRLRDELRPDKGSLYHRLPTRSYVDGKALEDAAYLKRADNLELTTEEPEGGDDDLIGEITNEGKQLDTSPSHRPRGGSHGGRIDHGSVPADTDL